TDRPPHSSGAGLRKCLAATQFAIQSARDFSRLTRPEKDENSRELDSKAKNQPAVGRFDPEHVIWRPERDEKIWVTCKHKNNGHYPGPFWGGDEQFAFLSMLE